MIWHAWWIWIAGGLVLAVLELLAPGFILLGFAIGAVLTGALIWLGVLGGGVPAILVVFGVASAIGWLALRKVFGRPGAEQRRIWERDINDD
jgi:membrane protein implicated in regulation of membrane protease activity